MLYRVAHLSVSRYAFCWFRENDICDTLYSIAPTMQIRLQNVITRVIETADN